MGMDCNGGMELHDLLTRLRSDRGSYPTIAAGSGIKYTTLTKIACGKTKAPWGRTIKALQAYYAAQDAKPDDPLVHGQ